MAGGDHVFVTDEPVRFLEEYKKKSEHVPGGGAQLIDKVLQQSVTDSTLLLAYQDEGQTTGFAILKQAPSAWQVDFFHFLDQTAMERGLAAFLTDLNHLLQMSKDRIYSPALLKIRFPLGLFDPKWSQLMFVQRGFQAVTRVEIHSPLTPLVDKLKDRIHGSARVKDLGPLQCLNYRPELFEEFVKMGAAAHDQGIDHQLFYSDYFSRYDSYRRELKEVTLGKFGIFLPECSFLVVRNNHMLGMCMVIEREGDLYLFDIGVLPSARRQQIGSKVLKKIGQFGLLKGFKSMALSVIREPNPSLSFYKSLGFQTRKQQLWYVKKVSY